MTSPGGSKFFNPVPGAPRANLGGPFSDISQGLSGFVSGLRDAKQEQADNAFREMVRKSQEETEAARLAETKARREQRATLTKSIQEARSASDAQNTQLRRDLEDTRGETARDVARIRNERFASEAEDKAAQDALEGVRARTRLSLLSGGRRPTAFV